MKIENGYSIFNQLKMFLSINISGVQYTINHKHNNTYEINLYDASTLRDEFYTVDKNALKAYFSNLGTELSQNDSLLLDNFTN